MDWETFLTEFAVKDEEEADDDYMILLEELERLHAEPMNINQLGRDDLLQLPFMNESQADSIVSYRLKHHRFTTLGELQYVRGVTYRQRRWLSLFVYVGDTLSSGGSDWVRQLTRGRHEVETDAAFPLYERAGYATPDEGVEEHPSRYYLGRSWSHALRYRYKYRQEAAYGVTLQKDSGEPFGSCKNYPYDFVSAYFYLRPNNGHSAVWLGDYRMRIAQGLLMGGSGFWGKQGAVVGYPRWMTRVSEATGSDETNYFRGVAAQSVVGKWTFTGFLSVRALDGTIKDDTLTAFKTDGMHRTLTEIRSRRTVDNLVAGGNASYYSRNLHWGFSGYYSHYNRVISPRMTAYNKYRLRGRKAAAMSFDYNYMSRRWTFSGEVAADRNMNFAAVQSLQYTSAFGDIYTVQLRAFSPRFVSPFARPLQEGSVAQNEMGLLLGASGRFSGRLAYRTYVDMFRFPRPTYRVFTGSQGIEGSAEVTYVHRPACVFGMRYRVKSKEQNVAGHKTLKEYVVQHRLRFWASRELSRISWQVSVDGTLRHSQTESAAFGWMASLRGTCRLLPRTDITSFVSVYFTDDYDTRIYAYVPQLRYMMAFPTFYYHGTSGAIMLRHKFSRRFEASLRYGLTHYFNRESTGSGAAQINTPTRNDLAAQLRMFF